MESKSIPQDREQAAVEKGERTPKQEMSVAAMREAVIKNAMEKGHLSREEAEKFADSKLTP